MLEIKTFLDMMAYEVGIVADYYCRGNVIAGTEAIIPFPTSSMPIEFEFAHIYSKITERQSNSILENIAEPCQISTQKSADETHLHFRCLARTHIYRLVYACV